MKKIWDKYKAVIIVGVFLALFVALSFILEDKNSKTPAKTDPTVSEWVNASTMDEYTLVVLGSSTCPNCTNFKPVYEKVTEEYGITAFWFEVDKVSSTDYTVLTTTYDISSEYAGSVPFTFITKHGVYIDSILGYVDEETFKEFLKTNSVIE